MAIPRRLRRGAEEERAEVVVALNELIVQAQAISELLQEVA